MTSSTTLLVLHVKHCVLGEIMIYIYVEIRYVLPLHVSPTWRFLLLLTSLHVLQNVEDFLHERQLHRFCSILQLFCYKSCSWQLHLEKPTSVMAPVSYTEICKQLESCYSREGDYREGN